MNILSLLSRLESIDRRVIYLFVALALAVPIVSRTSLPPAEMESATMFYQVLEKLEKKPGEIVMVSADWGPGTSAENAPQTAAAIEHLMRQRIPFALISNYSYSTPYLQSLPLEVIARLEKENPGEHWDYGKDWVNLGYRPGGFVLIQGMAKAENLAAFLKTDASGTPLEDIPCFRDVKNLRSVPLLMQFTGLVGVFSTWVQFFQAGGYKPPFVHGCTSITIPEAHTYLASGQIVGLQEGVAGAAWYEHLLSGKFPNRIEGEAPRNNTALAFAQLLIIGLIVFGNLGQFAKRERKER